MDEKYIEEYTNRYNELLAFISKAFYDLFVLEELERFNERIRNGEKAYYKTSHGVIQHICQVLKEDLALSICKSFSDQADAGHEVNTIPLFNIYIRKNFNNSNIELPKCKMNLSKDMEQSMKKIVSLRKQFLAHIDTDRYPVLVQTNDMRAVLFELREKLNALCIHKINPNVQPLTEEALNQMRFEISHGLGYLLENGTVNLNENNQEVTA